jgi:hypothetical protein
MVMKVLSRDDQAPLIAIFILAPSPDHRKWKEAIFWSGTFFFPRPQSFLPPPQPASVQFPF